MITNITRGKVWGNTSTIFQQNNVEIARIFVKKGGYCSKHIHKHKYNLFYVESGAMEIIIYRHDAGKIIEDITLLEAGGTTYVEPEVYHKFVAKEDTVALEVYWTELSPTDIERDVVGGMQEAE